MTEQQYIEEHFRGRTGTLLEIGGYDGRTDSLTCDLIGSGWGGVLVEPSPAMFLKLLQYYSNNPRVQLVNAAVGGTADLREFWYGGECSQTSTLRDDFRRYFEEREQAQYTRYLLATCTVTQLQQLHPSGFELMVIDAEGVGLEIVKSLPLANIPRTELIGVEQYGDADQRIDALHGHFVLSMNRCPNLLFTRP